jgi:hypothetical protein
MGGLHQLCALKYGRNEVMMVAKRILSQWQRSVGKYHPLSTSTRIRFRDTSLPVVILNLLFAGPHMKRTMF